MKNLIVVADDFAISCGASRGIIKACQEGIVTATSAMAVSPWLEETIPWLKNLPQIDTGIHLTLTFGKPLLPPHKVKSLVDSKGCFLPLRQWVFRALLGRLNHQEIEEEFSAQIERLKLLIPPLSHIDSHHHVHILPGICEITARLAIKHHIPFVRSFTQKQGWLPEGPWYRRFFMGIWKGAHDRYWTKQGLKTADHFGGHFSTGTTGLLTKWEHYLKKLPQGITEVMVHPGYANDLEGDSYREGRETEMNILCHPHLKEMVLKEKINLTCFRKIF